MESMMKSSALISLSAVLLAGSAGAALAVQTSQDKGDDAALLTQAALPLARAVGLAESHTNGRAVEAALEASPAGAVWEVTTLVNGAENRVAVNASTGAVSALAADEDRGGDGDGEEHDD